MGYPRQAETALLVLREMRDFAPGFDVGAKEPMGPAKVEENLTGPSITSASSWYDQEGAISAETWHFGEVGRCMEAGAWEVRMQWGKAVHVLACAGSDT